MEFKKASKKQQKLRLLIEGPSGAGKTYSALELAKGLGGRVAVVDTEKGSASLYSDIFEFDALELTAPFHPERYIEAIKLAEYNGFNVLIIDSISHEWSGEGGCLDLQEKLGGQYRDWAKVTPRHNKFIQAILSSKCHIIATVRTKSDYVVELNEKGKNAPRKVGLKAEQRDGLEFEFTTVLRLNQNHLFECSKDRTRIFDGKNDVLSSEHGKILMNWLNSGEPEQVQEEEKSEMQNLDPYESAIKASSTIDELKIAWESIPKSEQKNYAELKNSVKSLFNE